MLDLSFNAAVTTLARKVWPLGYDVSDDIKYASAPDANAYFAEIERTRRVTIYTGGSERTIFGEPEINWDFRAWHEWSHFILRAPFDINGELAVAHRQCQDLARVFGHEERTIRWQGLIMAEVYGQALYFKRHGSFPADQVAFDVAYATDNFDDAFTSH
jgi:hypothetical protein